MPFTDRPATPGSIVVEPPTPAMQFQIPPKPVETPPEVPPAPPMSVKLAQERAKERELRAKEASEKAKIDSTATELAALKAMEAKFKADPAAALAYYGHTYDSLTQSVLGQKPPKTPDDVINLTKKEVEALREEIRANEKARLEAEQAAQKTKVEQAVVKFKADITSTLEQEKDTYELVNILMSPDDVYSYIENTYEAEGKEISIKEAAEALEAQLDTYMDKIMVTKKFSSKYVAITTKPTTRSISQKMVPQPQPVPVVTPKAPSVGDQRFSPDLKWQEALAKVFAR